MPEFYNPADTPVNVGNGKFIEGKGRGTFDMSETINKLVRNRDLVIIEHPEPEDLPEAAEDQAESPTKPTTTSKRSGRK
jgi:hypothetical protein